MKRIRTTDYYKSSKSNESLERIKHVCKLKMQILGDDSDIGVSDIEILIPMNVELDHKLEILFNETKKALAKNTTAKPLRSLWTATFAKNASICLNKHKHLFSNIDFLEFHIKKLSNQYTQTLLNPKTFPPRLRPTKVLVTNLTINTIMPSDLGIAEQIAKLAFYDKFSCSIKLFTSVCTICPETGIIFHNALFRGDEIAAKHLYARSAKYLLELRDTFNNQFADMHPIRDVRKYGPGPIKYIV